MKIHHTLEWKSGSWAIILLLSLLIMWPWVSQFHRASNSLFVMWPLMHNLVKYFKILKICTAKLIWSSQPYVLQLKQNMLNQRKDYFWLRPHFISYPRHLNMSKKYAYLWTYMYRLKMAKIMLCCTPHFQWHTTIFNLYTFEGVWRLVDLNWAWLGWSYSSP